MDTQDQRVSKEELEKFKKYLDKFIAECDEEKVECVRTTKERMEQEVAALQEMLPVLSDENTYPDEHVMLLHNIICIVPEEQYRFLDPISILFSELPSEIRSKDRVLSVINRLNEFKIRDLDTKVQTTDMSMYWVEYRRTLATYCLWDNSRQRRLQNRMRQLMYGIAKRTIKKRTQGIKSAEIILRNFENQKK